MRKAWVENERIRDIAPGNPTDWYHPDVAVFYDTEVPDEAENGDWWANGKLIKPEPYVPPVVPKPSRTWVAADVRAGLILNERVRWDNDESATIKTAKIEMATPQELEHTTEVLQMLVDAGDIAQTSMDKVLE